MSDRYSKVIGYFAYASPAEIVCTGKACVISGSQRAMRDYISEINPEGWKKNTIKKTKFGEILRGLQLGAAYAFDEESYAKFYLIARKEGLPVAEGDFKNQKLSVLQCPDKELITIAYTLTPKAKPLFTFAQFV